MIEEGYAVSNVWRARRGYLRIHRVKTTLLFHIVEQRLDHSIAFRQSDLIAEAAILVLFPWEWRAPFCELVAPSRTPCKNLNIRHSPHNGFYIFELNRMWNPSYILIVSKGFGWLTACSDRVFFSPSSLLWSGFHIWSLTLGNSSSCPRQHFAKSSQTCPLNLVAVRNCPMQRSEKSTVTCSVQWNDLHWYWKSKLPELGMTTLTGISLRLSFRGLASRTFCFASSGLSSPSQNILRRWTRREVFLQEIRRFVPWTLLPSWHRSEKNLDSLKLEMTTLIWILSGHSFRQRSFRELSFRELALWAPCSLGALLLLDFNVLDLGFSAWD